MASVDTSIYGAIRTPSEITANRLRLENAGMQNKLAQLALDEKGRETESQNALAAAYRNATNPDGTIDRTKLFTSLATGGQGARIPGIQKTFSEQDKADADLQSSRIAATGKKLDIASQAFGYVRNNPTLEAANQALDFLQTNGIYSPEQVQQYKQQVSSNPAAIKQLADLAFTAALSAKDQLVSYQTRNTGATTDTISMNPVTGDVRVVNSVRNTQSPDSVASNATTRRGQDMVDARAREANQAGKAPAGYRYTPDGNLEAIPGGPADIKAGELGAKRAKSQQAAIAQADRVIGKVDQALKKVGWDTAGGPGKFLSGIPGTEAKNLETDLETIKANLGFAELQAMRDASPTGGALGAIAVQELTALQSTIASLDQAQSPSQLRARLGEIRNHYSNWKKAVGEANGTDSPPSGKQGQPVIDFGSLK